MHLADKVVIVKGGKIAAQGSYDQLKENKYMKQVMDIHNTHQKESKEIAEQASKSNEIDKLGSDNESDKEQDLDKLGIKIESLCKTEEELNKKLKVF